MVIVLYHREEETRRMFNQLERVTDNYSIIMIDNGFDDSEFIKKLNPLHYIKNTENTGTIKGINQGLELAEGKYVAVLCNDILIYDDEWLDHIIQFMERRTDVGLVGLGGWHVIEEDGSCVEDVYEVDRTGWRQDQPVWRLTEVAAIKGAGWVTRKGGIRLGEEYESVVLGCDLDLSLRYQSLGFKVYSANIDYQVPDLGSLPGDVERNRKILVEKWADALPVSRRYGDEKRACADICGLQEELDRLAMFNEEAAERHRKLEEEWKARCSELEELQARIRRLEAPLLAAGALSGQIGPDSSFMKKSRYYIKNEGVAGTIKRSPSYIKRRIGRSSHR
jgi:glycosyltransferase involved in cell wall biosynthesis